MIDQGRRKFFSSIFSAGAALATAAAGGRARADEPARGAGAIRGVCLYVPSLREARAFVERIGRDAPGRWTARALEGGLTDCYFAARALYEEARGTANTFVGLVDPATFAVVHEAIVDAGGSFHYVAYVERGGVSFSAQV